MFIEPRKRRCRVDELLHGMIVQSGNDAVDRARRSGRRQRGGVRRADERRGDAARHDEHALRERDRPAGSAALLDRERPRDARAALIRDFPEYYPLYSLKEYRYNNITQPNRNRLLWIDPYVDGMKTGHTDAAGWCLVASAKRGERRVLVRRARRDLGCRARQRSAEAPQLRLPVVRHRASSTQSGKPVSTLRVWKGADNDVAAGFLADQYLTLPKGTRGQAQADDGRATSRSIAPVAKGAARRHGEGRARGQAAGRVSAGRAGRGSGSANIFGRAWDTVRLWLPGADVATSRRLHSRSVTERNTRP